MNKRLTRVVKVIEDASSINISMKLLNLELNSYFLCLLNIVEDSIINYKEGCDYSYLEKTSEYLEIIFYKLNTKIKQDSRSNILLLRKICKKMQSSLIKKDRLYFEKLYKVLNDMLINNKKEKSESFEEEIDLYDFLDEIIFNMQSLEYLDKIIDNIPGILNSEKDTYPIFGKLINEYIKQIIITNDSLINYYERVINKFLLEETFDLSDQMREDIIKTLNNFANHKKNLSCKNIKKIKYLMEQIDNKKTIFELFDIQKTDPVLFQEDLDLFKIPLSLSNRIRINDYIITIDEKNSKVLDDAISFAKLKNGNTLFKVHIADPLAILPYDSKTLAEAKKRATTIYYPSKSVNMLPLIFSEDKLSLNQNQERFAKTFCYEFDKNFNIVKFYILNTIIKVSDRLSYDQLNLMYKKGGTSEFETNLLSYYDALIVFLKNMLIHVKNYHEQKEKNGNRYAGKNASFAENLVSYSMILTGYMTSKYFYDNNIPYVYRCNNLDDGWIKLLDKMIENSDSLEYQRKFKLIKGNLFKSYYSMENRGHIGLGLESYSHITSPLRRYCDLLNMLVLDTCYFKNPTNHDVYNLENEIKKVCEYLNMQNNTIDDYLRSKSKIK